MKKFYGCLLLICIFSISACGHNEIEDLQMMSLYGIDTIHIDHGSTTVHVSTADVAELEASLLMHDNGPGVLFDKERRNLKIRLKSDVRRVLNIGQMPELFIRVPIGYEGKIIVDGSSGHVNINDLYAEELDIRGKSGNISLDYTEITNEIKVSVKSGNVLLKLENTDSNVHWLLQTGSGRRSVAIPLENRQQTSRKTEVRTGDGSFNIQIKTASGNITVK